MDGYNATTGTSSLGERFGLGSGLTSRWRSHRLRRWLPFFLCVMLPTLLGAIYYAAIASDQYVSEAQFIVRSPGHSSNVNPLSSLLQSTGVGRAEDDTFAVNNYMQSRDALAELVKDSHLRAVFARPEADFLARFPHWPASNQSLERLYDYYQNHVQVLFDSTTGITTLTVRTFRPGDSRDIAIALLQAGERLVNRLNERATANAVRDAKRELTLMEQRVVRAEANMAAFRNREEMIDPSKQSLMMVQGVAELDRQLAATNTLIAQMRETSPNSPMLKTAEQRATAIRAQIATQQNRVTGSNKSIVPRIAEYDQLELEQSFAAKALTSATAALETARIAAERQQLYLDRVVEPNVPDYPLYPRRLAYTLIVFGAALAIYLIGRLLITGMLEHKAH